MMRTIQLAAACVAVMVVTAGQLQAGIITYTDKTAFLNALESYSVDSFNDLDYRGQSYTSPMTRTVSPYDDYKVQSSGGLYSVGPSVSDVYLSTNDKTSTIFFTPAVTNLRPTAIGGYFFVTNAPGQPTSGEIRVSINDPETNEQSVTTDSATNFFGWVSTDSTPISRLALSSNRVLFPTVNDLIFGQAAAATGTVPEPSSLALFGMGACVAGVGAARRHRREKQQEATA